MKTHFQPWLAIAVLALTALTALGLVSRPADAAGPWYVAPGGNDGNSCLSAGTPCATMNAAIGKASAGDTVLVATGTYTAASGSEVVNITQTVTLSGGWDLTFTTQAGVAIIDGGGARGGITVNESVTTTVESFVIQNGNTSSGGGIFNAGTLTLTNSAVSRNTSSQHGGGIYNLDGTLTLINSTVSRNRAQGTGGGIANFSNVSELTLHNSAVSGNAAVQSGGIYNAGVLTLNNSTVSDNTAQPTQAGGLYNVGTANLNSSTVSGNASQTDGGGLYNVGTLTMQNSVVAGNAATGTGPDCSGSIGSSGYNLIGNTSGCTFTPATGDMTNTNPKLGQAIGSPAYQPLLSGSPAIDAGNPGGCMGSAGLLTADQRGAPRVGTCDMGAYEFALPGPAHSIVAVSGSPQHAPPQTAFVLPLRAAVVDSIGSPVSNTVVLFSAPASGASGTFAASGTYTTTDVSTASGVVTATTFLANELRGTYAVSATVSGVITPATFLLSNLAWHVTTAGNDNNDCQTPVTACATINGALSKGGFFDGDTVFVASGTYTGSAQWVVLVTRTATLSGGWNAAFTTRSGMSTLDGGGVRQGFTVEGYLVVVSLDRFVVQNGTGNHNNYAALTLNHSTVSGNTGYGIHNTFGSLILNHSTVSSNWYAGIQNDGRLTLNHSTVSNNLGVGIYGGSSSWTFIISSTISGNVGGLHNNATLTMTNSTISGNTFQSGITNAGALHLSSSTISGNTGGGVINSGFATLQNTILAGNQGSEPGIEQDCSGTIDSAGYNLIGNTAGCTFNNTTGDLLNVDPKLWPTLAGAPGTRPLLPGSPAINAGHPTGCRDQLGNLLTTDQRGVARVGRCDIGAYEFDPNNSLITHVLLPAIWKPKPRFGINGTVTENGVPVAGVALDLRFFNGSSFSTIASTATDADGDYFFTGIPSLAPGQTYYVRYLNPSTPSRLFTWHTRILNTYTAGSVVDAGNFDIANIELVSPAAGATVPLPQTFLWTKRLATPSDNYEFNLFDYADGNPYFYTAPPLGYVGGYTLTGLPPGFDTGTPYVWTMWTYSPDGGYGVSYWAYYVTFSSAGAALTTVEQQPLADKWADPHMELEQQRRNHTRP